MKYTLSAGSWFFSHPLRETQPEIASDPAEIETHRACLIVLEAVKQDTLKLVEKVPDALFMKKPECEKWSYHDLVNHLITDEDGEFSPGPPDSILHRIKTDCAHLRQLANFMRKDGLLPPADHYDK